MREYREFVNQQQRARGVGIAIFGVTILVLGACILIVARTLLLSTPEPTPTTTRLAGVTPTIATVVLTPPTSTPPPPSTATPAETLPPTPVPTGAPSPEPPRPSSSDPQGDVGVYESGVPVEQPPTGIDIRATSMGADLGVVLQPAAGVPQELAEWIAEEEILVWISLHDPVPDPLAVFADWVVVLDLDGDVATGRPAGTVRINPDLGYEVAIGVSYDDTTGAYEPYFLVWDAASSALIAGPGTPRFVFNEARTSIGLALPRETLAQSVEQLSGVTLVDGQVKGRAAAQSYAGAQKVVDFCPDLPD